MATCIDYAVSIMAAAAKLQAMDESTLLEFKDALNDLDDEIHGILDYIQEDQNQAVWATADEAYRGRQ